ncbi:teashirt homolog 2 [Conger conger]|uniref:teashirt homolog 2 n=1 Tax=Conger conger TaxID=82655 RepID=UPI002A5AD91C|nr:teashirt homolog 2 [Conger conger]
MPRRKQQAPKRAAVYMPDDDGSLRESIGEDDADNDTLTEEECSEKTSPKVPEDKETDNKSSYSYQNSPISVLSNQEAELESRLSDASDRLSDFKSASPPGSHGDEESRSAKLKDEMHSSLEKMRAAYANFLSDSYWTGIGLDPKAGANASKGSCDSTNGTAKGEFDWHQDALSKTFQQNLSPKPISKPNLFSSVHLYRQSSSKACGTVFTGASRFRCKDCSAAYDTLVELTVHMNKSGHYQDDNHSRGSGASASSSKVRKRNLQDMEGKEDAQKVLKCMFCGHSFDSLQDLSVHMIKTKHYQKVPLKEPIPVIAPKLIPPSKKRAFEVTRPCSPDSTTGVSTYTDAQRASGLHSSHSNRYGYQNGASYTWQFETCKSQILKCMECGSSHDTLQQLTTHMMVTGHFIKVTSSASKKGKQLALDPLAVEKMQALAEPPASESHGDADSGKVSPKSVASGDAEKDTQKEGAGDKPTDGSKEEAEEVKDDKQNGGEEQKSEEGPFKYPYLREEDLEQVSGGGGDILKSLANTVASAINKAQTGTPSWSAYPSIHAAYQLSGVIKSAPLSASSPIQLKQTFNNKLRPIAPKGRFFQGGVGTDSFQGQRHSRDVKKDRGPMGDGMDGQNSKSERAETEESDSQEDSSSSKIDSEPEKERIDTIRSKLSPDFSDRDKASPSPPIGNGVNHIPPLVNDSPEILGINPLSALQSVLNNHLGKANKPSNPKPEATLTSCSQSLFSKPSRGLEKPALALVPPRSSRISNSFLFQSNDQPIDLTKYKNHKMGSLHLQSSTPVPQKHALSDIADMVKVLPKATTPKPSVSSRMPAVKLETDVRRFEDVSAEIYSVHKRKGRQSNWNPQHLLILQAQFASSLFLTSEGKYLLSDLGPQERMHISKFTGLSMTTISHWLANVKYQLRKTGGTKFLKNMDTGSPIFYCNDCASQFRTPAAFICHLESHLGFQIKDMSKLPIEHQTKVEPELSKVLGVRATETLSAEEDLDSKFRCKLCSRTFASNHAVKLHLSKTHSKSPENHSQYVEMDKD